jgi:hypothetical protein
MKMSHRHKPEPPKNRQLEELIELERAELRSLREIANELKPKHLTASISNVFTGESPMANNVLVFNVGQTSIDTITPLLADGVTLSGGTLSAVSVTFSDPSATAVLNPDNTITFTGVADSAGVAVGGTVTATVTDTDGAVFTFTQAFTVTTIAVTPPPPAQLTQSIANVFSVPTP